MPISGQSRKIRNSVRESQYFYNNSTNIRVFKTHKNCKKIFRLPDGVIFSENISLTLVHLALVL